MNVPQGRILSKHPLLKNPYWTSLNKRRQAGKQAGRQASRQAGMQAGRQGGKQSGRQARRQAGTQAGRQAGKEASNQPDADFWSVPLWNLIRKPIRKDPGSQKQITGQSPE